MSDFEDYGDEEFYAPAVVGDSRRPRRDLETDLREMLEMVSRARTMPLSNTAMVPRDELVDMIEAALRHLPEEIKQARRDFKERAELMAEQAIKAEQMLEQVKSEAARLVERSEIVRQSKLRAEQIEADARAKARTMIREAEDFIDEKLAGFEIVLDRTMKTVISGRERLAAQGLPPTLAEPDDALDDFLAPPMAPPPALPAEDDGGITFFDQDAEDF